MKRIVALCLSIALVFGITACRGSASTVTSTKALSTTAITTAKAVSSTPAATKIAITNANASSAVSSGSKAEGTTGAVYIDPNASNMKGTIRFWTAFDGQYGTNALIDDFHKYYPNIDVKYTVYKNDTEGNLTADTALLSGDVEFMLSFGTHNTSSRWENGMLLDITDKLKKDNLDLKKEWGTDAYTYNGKVFCFPSGGLSVFVALNMTMWKAAGLGDIPKEWTWDEYIEACKKMTKKDATGVTEVYGGTDFNQRDYWTYALRQSKGVDAFYKTDGSADFDNPLCSTILNRELAAEKDGVWFKKIQLLTDGKKSRDLLFKGNVASCIESIITRFVMDTKNNPHDFIMGYAPYPVNKKGETNYALGNMPNSFFVISKDAKDADVAYAFAKFASTKGGKYLIRQVILQPGPERIQTRLLI